MNTNDNKFLAQKIRSQYVEKGTSELDELRALDKKAKKGANIFSYVFGSIGAIVLGGGMSLVMTDIGAAIAGAMGLGISVGVVGLAMVIANYPIYKKLLKTSKEKYASRILELSEKIIAEENK